MPLFDAAVTSDFGLRHHPILGKVDEHRGVDLYSRTNRDAVLAVAPGVVKEAGYSGGYGNMVLVEHNGGIETLYGHMASVLVHPGQSVAAGTQLGQVGNTGLSTGKHLHFEVLVENVPLDPEKVISAARNLQ
jgi:murein DD-endopeptidase MepM/ murein hydrolase activator NlpD